MIKKDWIFIKKYSKKMIFMQEMKDKNKERLNLYQEISKEMIFEG